MLILLALTLYIVAKQNTENMKFDKNKKVAPACVTNQSLSIIIAIILMSN